MATLRKFIVPLINMESNSRVSLKMKVANALWSLANKCLSNCGPMYSLYATAAIAFEITDKVTDGAIAVDYHRGRLFSNPNRLVPAALLVFLIFGCVISIGRICLYFYDLHLILTEGNYGEEDNGARSLQINALKVTLEAFPQSVIARFYFVHCPLKRYVWGYGLAATFDFFCGSPFIFFFVSLFWYLLQRAIKRGCKMELNGWIACALIVLISMSTLGLTFAASSLSYTYKQCS